MNQVPEEITIEELPAYGEKALGLRPVKRVRKAFRLKYSQKLIDRPVFIMTAGDGTTLYVRIGDVFRKTGVWLTKNKAIDIYYQPSVYIKSDDDIRRIAGLIGTKRFAAAVAKASYVLTDELVESLFEQDKTVFWVSKNGKRLLASAFDINQERYGPLQEVNAIQALKRYGVSSLDEAIERGIAGTNG